MKQAYNRPEADVIGLEDSDILAGTVDTSLGSDAVTPAKGRELFDDWSEAFTEQF